MSSLGVVLGITWLFALPWALGFGIAGWNSGIRNGTDPALASMLAWMLGPLAFPLIRRIGSPPPSHLAAPRTEAIPEDDMWSDPPDPWDL